MSHTLLLADDSVTIQRVIALTFAAEDINVIAVGDGRQAIERITADPPDIVLADTSMPERDGYEVAAFIKRDPALEHIPVMLLTGAFEPVDSERASEVGCDGVLVKPFEPQAVVGHVRELLGLDPVEEASAHSQVESAGAGIALELEDDAPPTGAVGVGLDGVTDAALSGESTESLSSYLDQLDAAFERIPGERSDEESSTRRDAVPEVDTPDTRRQGGGASSDSEALDGALSAIEEALDTLSRQESRLLLDDQEPAPEEAPVVSAASPVTTSVEGVGPDVDSPVVEGAVREVSPDVTSASESSVPTPVSAAAFSSGSGSPPPPTLGQAFVALLAAERGEVDPDAGLPSWRGAAADLSDNDELIERVAERVIARLSEGVTAELVADVVARVAERLVSEEIARNEQD